MSTLKYNWQKRFRLATLLATLFLPVTFRCAYTSDAKKSGWYLVQRQAQLGVHHVYLTHDAIKMVNESLGYTVLACGPDWKVSISRPSDHVQYVYPSVKTFLNNSMLGIVSVNEVARRSRFVDLGEVKVGGLRVQKTRPINKFEELWILPDLDLAPQVLSIANCWFQTYAAKYPYRKMNDFVKNEPVHGPIWTSGNMGDVYSGRTAIFDTVSIAKRNFPASEFAYPKGYKSAKNPTEVIVARSRALKFNDMLQQMESDFAESK